MSMIQKRLNFIHSKKELSPAIIFILLIIILYCGVIDAHSANLIYSENFDDQAISLPSVGSMMVTSAFTYSEIFPPKYNLTSVGRGGNGYCFSGAQNVDAWILWRYNQTWPTDEMYISYWQKFENYSDDQACSSEIFKMCYPHWGSKSKFDITVYNPGTLQASMCNDAGGYNLPVGYIGVSPDPLDGNWHHFEIWVQFSTGHLKLWYDGKLKKDSVLSSGSWPRFNGYLTLGSADGTCDGTFLRQFDDWEVWDGMPGSTPPPTDTTPPGYVANFTGQEGDGQVLLNWTNPSDSDFSGTMIRYKTNGSYPANQNDGTLLTNRSASPGSDDSYTASGLTNGTTYYFSAFTYDGTPNYSGASQVSAVPSASVATAPPTPTWGTNPVVTN